MAKVLALVQVPINNISARPSFIDETKFQVGLVRFFDEFIQSVERAADLAVEFDLGVPLGRGAGTIDSL